MTMIDRRTVVLAAASFIAMGPAFAQQAAPAARPAAPVGDPVAALRAFYAKPENVPAERFMSARLKRLYEAQQRRSRRSGDVLPGLDFQFSCGCQDNDDDYATRNVYTLSGRTEREATVAVKLKLFKTETETRDLTFKLVLENGRWLIDDVLDTSANPWVFSRLLQMRE